MILAEPTHHGGLIIAAPSSGSGKTTLTLGLVVALRLRGLKVAAAKTGPDYIDASFLGRAADMDLPGASKSAGVQLDASRAPNFDPWAMSGDTLRHTANEALSRHNLLVIEGVMGLFDGASDGTGSTADLAASLGLPVVLVVDAARQSQSVAALCAGFINWRNDVHVTGVILNNIGSDRHATMLTKALEDADISVLGTVPRQPELKTPSRHLGLVLPNEVSGFDKFVLDAAQIVTRHCNLEAIAKLAAPPRTDEQANLLPNLPPLGQHIAVAKDAAFAFVYTHWLKSWQTQGAQISFFSPLNDEAPPKDADAIFLPGGYPELHAARLANAANFAAGMVAARDRNALVYGECGGYMVLGAQLVDKQGSNHKMLGLFPHTTRIDRPKRVLGYRRLSHVSPLPFPTHLTGHEFHYSASNAHGLPALFEGRSADNVPVAPMGAVLGRVMGSYAHVIDQAVPDDGADPRLALS